MFISHLCMYISLLILNLIPLMNSVTRDKNYDNIQYDK